MYSYTVNDPDRALQLLSGGVIGVFSDFPESILAAIARAGGARGKGGGGGGGGSVFLSRGVINEAPPSSSVNLPPVY